MASRGAIGAMTDKAISRIQVGAQKLADFTGVQPVSVEFRRYRDPEYERALLLERLGDWVNELANVVVDGITVTEKSPVPVEEVEIVEDEIDNSDDGTSDYSQYTNKQLRTMAEERGINAAPLRNKAELIDALEAADRLTEDEQEAKHETDGEPN